MAGAEQVDLVDERDVIVGGTTVGECLEHGLLHRAVAVVVSRGNGKVVLQQRSWRDSWHPGKWTLSCTGHVRRGESYAGAAARELREELGIGPDIKPLKKFLLPPMREGGKTEHEWVMLFSASSDEEAKPDPIELEGVKDFTRDELGKMLEGGTLTPDAVTLLTDFLRMEA